MRKRITAFLALLLNGMYSSHPYSMWLCLGMGIIQESV